ncbi:MAG TPA: SMC-Scp complex subunit ScpB [Chthoniobacterales bacterium]|nr:SMC-Scp complex subunit ScpB [Chthoniobacterales bacterium]
MNNSNIDSAMKSSEETLNASQKILPHLSQILEALLFASQKAITMKEFLSYFKGASHALPESAAATFAQLQENDVLTALQKLREEITATDRSYELRETASGWQFVTAAQFAPWLKQMFPEARPSRLSAPALETLAIIAYRQPMTRADVEAVRGVAVDGVVQTLLDRGFIRIAGRSELPGRPLLYSTSQFFLDHFGLRHLEELPNAAELRYVPLPKVAKDSEASQVVALSEVATIIPSQNEEEPSSENNVALSFE